MATVRSAFVDGELAGAIDRSGDLKRELVQYAQTPRFERPVREALRNMADSMGGILDEASAAMALDDFIFTHRTGAGRTFIDDFVAKRRDYSPRDRQLLLSWRDAVLGLFEVAHKDRDSLLLLNLFDDLEYRTYSNMGPAVFRQLKKGGFVQGRLVPVEDVWVVSGSLATYPKVAAREIAKFAASQALESPGQVFRNPKLLERSWEMQRAKRDAFIAVFGGDEVVLPAAEAGQRMRELGFGEDIGSADSETVGLIYDEEDGFGVFFEYGKVKEMFADPALARDRSRAEVLLGYLRSDEIKPGVLNRLAAAHPDEADAVWRSVLRQRHFTWSDHGEALLRKHKPWFYKNDQYPGVVVLGDRPGELAGKA
jgi:hypothetical protein